MFNGNSQQLWCRKTAGKRLYSKKLNAKQVMDRFCWFCSLRSTNERMCGTFECTFVLHKHRGHCIRYVWVSESLCLTTIKEPFCTVKRWAKLALSSWIHVQKFLTDVCLQIYGVYCNFNSLAICIRSSCSPSLNESCYSLCLELHYDCIDSITAMSSQKLTNERILVVQCFFTFCLK